jgi:hypothetical protein
VSDPFAELFSLLTPERLLRHPQATGAGVRLGMIDGGVELSVLQERSRQRGLPPPRVEGAVFTPAAPGPLPWNGRQSTPHGTTVADILLSLAPEATLVSADVFGPAGSCEVDTLLRALTWLVDEQRCKIVNLSLGVIEHRLQPLQKRQQLLRAVEEAYYKDVLIFAAAHNDHPFTRSYPASFGIPVVGVNRGPGTDPFAIGYAPRERIEFQGYSRGYIGPFAADPATSWATPHLAGLAARLVSLRPTLKPFELKTLLYWLSLAQQDDGQR